MRMSASPLRFVLVIVLVVLLTPVLAAASSGGKSGGYVVGCGGCHGGASANTNVLLEGPRTVKAGSVSAYTFVVNHGQLRNAGFNLAFRSGTGNVGTLTAGPNTQIRAGELTHTDPTAFGGNGARFGFQWTAPAAHGVYNFAGAGNAVNNDGNDSDADDWAVTGNINITVTGANFTKPVAGASFCTGTRVDIEWQQTGLGNVRIEMSRDNFQTTEVINTTAASGLSTVYEIPASVPAGSYIIRMVDATTQEELARTAAVTIQAGPNITLQPQPTFVCAGKPLTLTVSSSGSNVLYRWRRNGVDIPGGTNPVLTINQATLAEAGVYQCVIFACSTSVNSNEVQVTVGERPQITRQPLPRAICDGDSASFSVAATGSDLRYQWLKNGSPMPEDTLPVLKFARATLFDEATYSCRVEGSCTPGLTSSEVKLDVTELPQIRTQPVDRSLRVGDTLVLSVEASGESLVYQWYRDGAIVPSGKDRILRIAGVAKGDSGVYRCMVFNKCDTVDSKTCVVRVTSVAGPGRLTLTSSSLSFLPTVACLTQDTILSGLLLNDGGSPITITSFSAEPIAKVEVVNLTAPFTLDVNERRDVQLRITPKDRGPYSLKITFFTNIGSQSLTIAGEGTPSLQFSRDTLWFAKGKFGERICNESFSMPCEATRITGIRLSGPSAGSWSLSPFPDTPIDLKKGDKFSLCIETAQDSGEDGLVGISTDYGLVTFVVARTDVTSVDADDDGSDATSVRVYPNPAAGEVTVKGLDNEDLSVSVFTAAGERVGQIQGSGELRWDRRDLRGALVPGGLYVLSIDGARSGRSIRKLILH